jgi:hypothetical protein
MFNSNVIRFKKYILENNIESFIFMKNIFKYSLYFLIIIVLGGIIIAVTMNIQKKYFLLLAELGSVILTIFSLVLFSFIEGYILFTIKGLINKSILNFNTLINASLSTVKPLFFMNLFFQIFAELPSLINYSHDYFVKGSNTYLILDNLLIPFFYFNALIVMITVCAPFSIITHGKTFKEAFKLNFRFIGNNLFKYIQFVFIAILLLFIPIIISMALDYSSYAVRYEYLLGGRLDSITYYSIFINFITSIIHILIAVLVYIAFFIFLMNQ